MCKRKVQIHIQEPINKVRKWHGISGAQYQLFETQVVAYPWNKSLWWISNWYVLVLKQVPLVYQICDISRFCMKRYFTENNKIKCELSITFWAYSLTYFVENRLRLQLNQIACCFISTRKIATTSCYFSCEKIRWTWFCNIPDMINCSCWYRSQ